MIRSSSWRFLLTLALVVALAAAAEACPNCKDTLANDPAKQGLVRGFYYSILFMMSMPFLILGSLCTYFWYLVRTAEKSRASEGDVSTSLGDAGG